MYGRWRNSLDHGLFRAGCCVDWEFALLNPTPEEPPVPKHYLSQVQCQQICFVLEMSHCSLLCCNLQLLFPALSRRSLHKGCTRRGQGAQRRRARGAAGLSLTCTVAMLAVATRLLKGSRGRVQVDSVLFSRCWRYLDKAREREVPSAGTQAGIQAGTRAPSAT